MAEYNDIEKRRADLKELLEKGCITPDGYETAMINLDKIQIKQGASNLKIDYIDIEPHLRAALEGKCFCGKPLPLLRELLRGKGFICDNCGKDNTPQENELDNE